MRSAETGAAMAPGGGRAGGPEGALESSGHSMASSEEGTAGSGGAAGVGGPEACRPRLPEEVLAAQDPDAERCTAGLGLLLASVGSSMEGCPLRGWQSVRNGLWPADQAAM